MSTFYPNAVALVEAAREYEILHDQGQKRSCFAKEIEAVITSLENECKLATSTISDYFEVSANADIVSITLIKKIGEFSSGRPSPFATLHLNKHHLGTLILQFIPGLPKLSNIWGEEKEEHQLICSDRENFRWQHGRERRTSQELAEHLLSKLLDFARRGMIFLLEQKSQ